MDVSATERSDAELARLTARGDRPAAGMLIARHQAMVRWFLRRLCGNADTADDLAQETFLRVLRYAHRYDPRYPMRTWLLTIARRLWISQRPRLVVEQAPAHDPVDATNDPARTATVAEQRVAIDAAMTQLTEPQRTAVLLFHLRELPLREVARVMEVPEGTVKSHLHRARALMRQHLDDPTEATPP